ETYREIETYLRKSEPQPRCAGHFSPAQLLSSIPIELVIAHAAAAHPSPPRSCLLGETGKHERGWPHIELSARPRRRNVLFRWHKQSDLDRRNRHKFLVYQSCSRH